MEIPSKLIVVKPPTIWDELCVWAGMLGTLTCIVYGSWLLVIIFVCATIVSYNNVQNDRVQVDVKPFKMSQKDLFQITDYVDGVERHSYLVADSFDEANLFCHLEGLKPGSVNILGKVKYFE